MPKELQPPPGYAALLKEIKERVRTAQVRASLAVNRELILLYWSIGRDILARQEAAGWGAKIIDRLAKDLAVPAPRVGDIVRGKRAISADTALRLGIYFGLPAQFWLNLQNEYDLRRAAGGAALKKVARRAA